VDKKEATAEIAELVKQAYAKIHAAEAIADKYGVKFSFDLAYGMGGWYRPNHEDWNSSACFGEDEGGWMASSQSC
jgi:hypothetical protein